jgi:hypothetical protein
MSTEPQSPDPLADDAIARRAARVARGLHDDDLPGLARALLARWVAAERRARDAEAEARRLSGQDWEE